MLVAEAEAAIGAHLDDLFGAKNDELGFWSLLRRDVRLFLVPTGLVVDEEAALELFGLVPYPRLVQLVEAATEVAVGPIRFLGRLSFFD